MYDRGEIMSETERLEILNWICSNFCTLHELPFNRRDYKLELSDKSIPIAIWKIKKRIMDIEGVRQYRKDPVFEDLITIILPNGSIHPHKDPNGWDSTIHTRFNVFIQLPTIPTYHTYYAGRPIESIEGHYVMCRSGLDLHWSSYLRENRPRIGLSFGFMLPREKVDAIYKLPPNMILMSDKMKTMIEPNEMFDETR